MTADGKTRHFVFLDGLRGIAALAVGLLHASQTFKLGIHPDHASLAVDFFFVLSGFVVSHAYDARLAGGMNFGAFIRTRLIRLYPMIFLGILLGSAVTLGAAAASHEDVGVAGACAMAAFFLIPLGLAFANQAFPTNGPVWSLFFEFAASIAYALNRERGARSQRLLVFALASSLACLLLVTHRLGTVQRLGFAQPVSFLFGFIRVAYPFLAGLAIHRFKLFAVGTGRSDLVLAPTLALVLFQPLFQNAWIYDAAAITILFPAMVALGTQDPSAAGAVKLWSVLGRLSYPFYLIHLPVLQLTWFLWRMPVFLALPAWTAAAAGVALAVGAAHLALVIFDQPVRRWLATSRRGPQGTIAVRAAGTP